MKSIAFLLLLLVLITPFAAIADPSDPWYNASWAYRVSVTVNNAQVDADLTDYPVYVDLSTLPAGFHANVKSDGSDIRVTAGDGTTELPREVVVYDAATDTGELHFKASSVANATDTEFYIYYGNAGASDYGRADTYGTENVWNSNYRAVYHLQEDGNTTASGYLDSTANDRHATGVSLTASSDVTGKLGVATTLDGSADYLTLPSGIITLASATDEITMQAWVNSDSTGGKNDPILSGRVAANENGILTLGIGRDGVDNAGTGFAAFIVRDNGSGGLQHAHDNVDISNDAWHMVHLTRNSSKAKALYVDGISKATGTDTMASGITGDLAGLGAERKWIATNFPSGDAPARYFQGEIDEARVLGVPLTAAWIDAEYSNHNTPTTFYTVGSQETPPASGGVIHSFLNFGTLLFNRGTFIFN